MIDRVPIDQCEWLCNLATDSAVIDEYDSVAGQERIDGCQFSPYTQTLLMDQQRQAGHAGGNH